MKDLPIGRIIEQSPDSAVVDLGGALRRLPILGTVGDGGTITWMKDTLAAPAEPDLRCPTCGGTRFGYFHARIGTFDTATGEIQSEGNDYPILYCEKCNVPDPFGATSAPRVVIDAYKQAFEEQERRHVD